MHAAQVGAACRSARAIVQVESPGEQGTGANAHVVVAGATLIVGERKLRDGSAGNAEGTEIDGIPGLVGTGVSNCNSASV